MDENKITIVDCDSYLAENKEEFLQYIQQITNTNYRTFPMVFLNGTFIGGYTETKKMIEQQTAFSDLESF
jgi:glutaredoxin